MNDRMAELKESVIADMYMITDKLRGAEDWLDRNAPEGQEAELDDIALNELKRKRESIELWLTMLGKDADTLVELHPVDWPLFDDVISLKVDARHLLSIWPLDPEED